MDRQARFSALYDNHAGAVRTYAARRSDIASADDVVADVFLAAWRRLDDIPDDPLPWLLGAARKVLANQRRSGRRLAALRDRLAVEPRRVDYHPADPAGDRVLQALDMLSTGDREVLLLTAWEDLEPARAARVLGIRTGTYAMRLSRARARLAGALATVDERDSEPVHKRTTTEALP